MSNLREAFERGGLKPMIPLKMTSCPLMRQLIEARVSTRLSQDALSEIAGYSRGSIYQWEAGRSSPNIRKFVDLANALGFDVVLVPKGDDTTRAAA